MGGPRRYGLAMWAVRWASAWRRFLPWHPGKLGAWTRGRELPEVPGPSFRSWWRQGRAGTGWSSADEVAECEDYASQSSNKTEIQMP